MIKNYIVVGAGLSGLNTASKIQQGSLGSVLILEKSRGVGGRMATRRTLETRFDHGAQFYRLKPDISQLHQKWLEEKISHHWFNSEVGDHWCTLSGMTSLAKALSANLEISLEKLIKSIHFENNCWKLMSDKGEVWECENLIVSSPLPQSVSMLEEMANDKNFKTQAFLELKKIKYTKALIGLITLEVDIPLGHHGYVEFTSGPIFSIADQKRKGISSSPALTVTMSPAFSEEEFEGSEDVVLDKIKNALIEHFPQAKIKQAELKKWRYCMPTTRYESTFLEIAPRLFLVGDAFGGSSLLGAVRSSNALCEYLIKNKL